MGATIAVGAVDDVSTASMSLPPPLLGADGPDTFTYESIVKRLPAIVEELVERLRGSGDPVPESALAELRVLAESMRRDEPLTPIADEPWYQREGSWLSTAWWYVENYAYRRMLCILRPVTGPGFDPFFHHKVEATTAATGPLLADIVDLVATPLDAAPEALVLRALWGNRADLSLSAGRVMTDHHHSILSGGLVRDDTSPASLALLRARRVVYVLDNTGLELLSDLVLMDWLLRGGRSVRVHAKRDPVFVSDALPKDVVFAIDWLARGAAMPADVSGVHPTSSPLRETATVAVAMAVGQRLRAALHAGQLSVMSDPYYNSPLEVWDSLPSIRSEYAAADVVVIKGDANYRRVVGDRHWEMTASLSDDVLSSTRSDAFPTATTALVLLRTLKSWSLVGADPALAAAAEEAEPGTWRTSGRWGVVHLLDQRTS